MTDKAKTQKRKLRPLNNAVVIRPDKAADMSAGGIVLPDNAKETLNRGEVLSVGPGDFAGFAVDGQFNRVPMSVKAGDVVLYRKYSGTVVEVEGEDFLILAESELLAVVE